MHYESSKISDTSEKLHPDLCLVEFSIMSLVYNGLSIGVILGLFTGAIYLAGHTYYVTSKARRRAQVTTGKEVKGQEVDSIKTCAPCSNTVRQSKCCSCDEGRSLSTAAGARELRCSLCGTLVCRACSRVVRPSARIRLCGTCYHHREIHCPSGEWIYRELKTKFHDVSISTSSSDSSLDVHAEVREFIERLTENLVGGSVDDVTIEPLSAHPQYVSLCNQYHPLVLDVLSRLSLSLQIAVTEFPTRRPSLSGESPSEVHVQLQRLINELRSRALEMPLLELDCSQGLREDEEGEEEENEVVPPVTSSTVLDLSRRSYEDLLATAIINKVVETAQCLLMEQHLRTPTSPKPPEPIPQDANETRGEEEPRRRSPTTVPAENFISCMQIGIDDYDDSVPTKMKTVETVTVVVESAVRETETKDDTQKPPTDPCDPDDPEEGQYGDIEGGDEESSWSGSGEDASPTLPHPTNHAHAEGLTRGRQQRRRRSRLRGTGSRRGTSKQKHNRGTSTEMQKFLEGLKYSHRVPFPELGADIVEGSVQESLLEETARTTLYLVNSGDSHHSSLSSASWEENWLFQRRRLRLAPSNNRKLNKAERSRVPMLVPNPRPEDSHVRVRVGEVDADQLSSDLSDYESYMSKDDTWSDPVEEDSASKGEPDSLESRSTQGLGRLGTLSDTPDIVEATNQEIRATCTLILASSNGNDGSEFDQQEGEYLEDFASIGQRSLTSLQEAIESSSLSETGQPGPEHSEATSSMVNHTAAAPEVTKAENKVQLPVAAPRREKTDSKNIEEKSEQAQDLLAAPPRPGTIAEREHRKWQQARPMPNNPYTEENIARRLGRRHKIPAETLSVSNPIIQSDKTSAGRTKAREPDTSTPDQPLRINCSGPQLVDLRQYGRDYYINENLLVKMDHDEHGADSPRESVTSTAGECASEAPSLADHEASFSYQPEESVTGSVDDSMTGSVSGLEFDSEEPVKMPSVRELAKQFAPLADSSQRKLVAPRTANSKPTRGRPRPVDFNNIKDVVIIDSSSTNGIATKTSTPAPVHSLTARNLSKGIRAGLRKDTSSGTKMKENSSTRKQNGSHTEEVPRPTERHLANLEFWRSLDPSSISSSQVPTPAPRHAKK